MKLNYNEEIEKIYGYIGKLKTMALASSVHNHPTVRLVSYIVNDRKIFFQTGTDLVKYKQICENNNVAVCIDNIQIEGIANIIGKTNSKQNSKIMEIYKKHHLNSYEMYSHDDREVLIEIIPIKIIKWDYENGKPYRIFINIEDETAKKEMYW